MSMKVSYYISNGKMCMTLPYELKDIFREFFKTASWNRTSKCFEAANSPANLKKWTKFMDATKTPLVELEKLEEEDISAQRLEAAAEKARQLLADTERKIQDCRTRANIAKALTEELAPQVKAAEERHADLLKKAADADNRLNAVLKPVLDLYERHDLKSILSRFQSAASRGYSGKQTFDFAQRAMQALTRDMRSIGYECEAFNELVDVSLNRHDKLPGLLREPTTSSNWGLRSTSPN
ncbi:hypothetical protein [Thauera humireducens]|uniref:hypothetical protein n=1 Tax=Thauera humireducens TaxID=1134435 RepID=UPI00311DE805